MRALFLVSRRPRRLALSATATAAHLAPSQRCRLPCSSLLLHHALERESILWGLPLRTCLSLSLGLPEGNGREPARSAEAELLLHKARSTRPWLRAVRSPDRVSSTHLARRRTGRPGWPGCLTQQSQTFLPINHQQMVILYICSVHSIIRLCAYVCPLFQLLLLNFITPYVQGNVI